MADPKPKTSTLIASTDCRVKKGEVQRCWGSDFKATEVPNPALKDEFLEKEEIEALPKTILVLKGEFDCEDEIKSLLKSKRATRA